MLDEVKLLINSVPYIRQYIRDFVRPEKGYFLIIKETNTSYIISFVGLSEIPNTGYEELRDEVIRSCNNEIYIIYDDPSKTELSTSYINISQLN